MDVFLHTNISFSKYSLFLDNGVLWSGILVARGNMIDGVGCRQGDEVCDYISGVVKWCLSPPHYLTGGF